MRRTDEAFKRELFRRYSQYKKNRRNLRILAIAPCALSVLLIFALICLPRLGPWQSDTPIANQPSTTTTGTTTTVTTPPHDPATDLPHDPATDLPHDPDNPLASWLSTYQRAFETQIHSTYSYRKEGQNYTYGTSILDSSVVTEERIEQISEFLRTMHMSRIEEAPTPGDGIGIAFVLEDVAELREKLSCEFFLWDQYLFFDDWHDNACYMITRSDADTLLSMFEGKTDYAADTDPLARLIAEGSAFGRLEYILYSTEYDPEYLEFRYNKETVETLTDFFPKIELTDVDWRTVATELSQIEPIEKLSICFCYFSNESPRDEFTIAMGLCGNYLALERDGYIYWYEIDPLYAEYLMSLA